MLNIELQSSTTYKISFLQGAQQDQIHKSKIGPSLLPSEVLTFQVLFSGVDFYWLYLR